jgi:hypothetical protein
MRDRCRNPKHRAYKNYGGRGITVCERWNSFENFYADVGDRPSPKHSIDRIDNDLGYEPGNVRWADQKTQSRNSRRNRLVAINGETLCLQDWAERMGLGRCTIYDRLRRGWSIERALTTPPARAPRDEPASAAA